MPFSFRWSKSPGPGVSVDVGRTRPARSGSWGPVPEVGGDAWVDGTPAP